MYIFTINEKTCNQCGACAAICYTGLIDFQKKHYPKPFPITERMCNRCAACMIVCPTQSLIHRDISYEQCPPLDPSLLISYEQCAQHIKNRRSIRSFKDKAVPRELIEKAIEAARYSPTGANIQNVQWLVFDNEKEIEHFRKVGFDWLEQMLVNNPTGNNELDFLKMRKEAGVDIFLRGAPMVVCTYAQKKDAVSTISCSVAIAYFDLAAISLGLGCCWDGMFTGAANTYPPIKDVVALPVEFEIYASLAVGFPKHKPLRLPMRKPAQITWH